VNLSTATAALSQVNWRDHLAIHPAAELFPPISETELKELAEDIKLRGLQNPVVIWKSSEKEGDELLLDGRNRLDALTLAGLLTLDQDGRLCLRQADGASQEIPKSLQVCADPYALAISLNIHRRHLTTAQRREITAEVLKAQPGSSDRAIAAAAKVDHKTVATVRSALEGRGEIPHVTARADSRGRTQPARKPKRIEKPADGPKAVEKKAQIKTNPIIAAWDRASHGKRLEFLKERHLQILRQQNKAGGSVFEAAS
jgi:ParB-like chromosome segregation protein Spo0J